MHTTADRVRLSRWAGFAGALAIGFGGVAAGALPAVDNAWDMAAHLTPLWGSLIASSVTVFVGIGLLVVGWLGLGRHAASLTTADIAATYAAWVAPLILTAPLFSQDIYSYLAHGAIVRHGLDPYSAGPAELLTPYHPLAMNVPDIWADAPSPYGPVALGVAAVISSLSGDHVVPAIIMHRCVALVAVAAGAWALGCLARRCGVAPQRALWLGVLNPLAILHLIAGLHNEALMLGFMLVGMEVAMRALERRSWPLFFGSGALLSCAGLVKVTGFVALGFAGMALARLLRQRYGTVVAAIGIAVTVQSTVLVLTAAAASHFSGTGFGWVTGQGGAAKVRSWLSITTDLGIWAGSFVEWLGMGNHTEGLLQFTRGAGMAAAFAFMAWMLWRTYLGTIHPVGGPRDGQPCPRGSLPGGPPLVPAVGPAGVGWVGEAGVDTQCPHCADHLLLLPCAAVRLRDVAAGRGHDLPRIGGSLCHNPRVRGYTCQPWKKRW